MATSTHVPRRGFHKAIPATSAALIAPTVAQLSEDEDPILPLYRQWIEARLEWLRWADFPGNGNWDMAESKAAEAQEDAALFAMTDITPISLAGIAALIHVLWDIDGPARAPENEDYEDEIRAPNYKLMLAIWRATSGRADVPMMATNLVPTGTK